MSVKFKIVGRSLFLVVWLAGFIIFHQNYAYQELLVDEIPQTHRFFSDSAFGGSSTCERIKKGDTSIFKFNLVQKDNQYAFTNDVIVFDEMVDVSEYDDFRYYLKGDYPNKLRLFLVMEIPEDTVLKQHTIEYFKEFGTEFEEHVIGLKEFQYQEYWVKRLNLKEEELGEFRLSNMKAVVFGSGSRSEIGREEQMMFCGVKFTKTITWPYYLFAGILIVVLLYWLISGMFRRKEAIVSVNYEAAENRETIEFPSVAEFISEKYMNPSISVSMICDQLDVSEAKVAAEIKKETSLSFKQLLNQLRIEEAKRLLVQSELLVSEISDLVGYENVTHFNRIFKIEVGQSPTDFRKLNKHG